MHAHIHHNDETTNNAFSRYEIAFYKEDVGKIVVYPSVVLQIRNKSHYEYHHVSFRRDTMSTTGFHE